MAGDQPNTIAAKQYVQGRWNITVGSYRAVGSVPNSDHPKGLALDCMTTNLQVGNEIEAWALSNPTWCKYTIWQRRYKTPAGVNEPYTGPSPHTDHVHISLIEGALFNPGSGGAVPVGYNVTQAGITDVLTAPFEILGKFLSFITNPGNWMRLGLFILGMVLVIGAAVKVGIGGNLSQVKEVMDMGQEAA